MKTKNELPVANCQLPRDGGVRGFASIVNRKSQTVNHRGFTLIELLTVIAIIGVLAGMIFAISGPAKIRQYRSTARGELEQIISALDNYKAKYGVYPPGNTANPLENQLYFELIGTTNINNGTPRIFRTLDGNAQINGSQLSTAFGVTALNNSSQYAGSGEDAVFGKNFLLGLQQNRVATNSAGVYVLVTSVRGTDPNYRPLPGFITPAGDNANPFRYVYPGTNNPNSYDLWIQLKVGGNQTNLICNWSKNVIVNSPLP